MLKFNVGDKVISSEFGVGEVESFDLSEPNKFWVEFAHSQMRIYCNPTGKRDPSFGEDSVRLVSNKTKKSVYIKGRRIQSLNDLLAQDFVIWKGKVYHKGWFSSWQIQFAMTEIYSKNGIWVANRIRRV